MPFKRPLQRMELAAPGPLASVTRGDIPQFADGHASEDARLVRDARDGDERAFNRLYDRYVRMVHGLLLARIPRADLDDLVQDVFLTAWRRLPSLRDPAAFGGWLAMITRNRATDFYRRSPDHVDMPEDLAAHDATMEHVEALAILDVIRSLPGAYRETLVLRLVEGLTGPEISNRTGLTAAPALVRERRDTRMHPMGTAARSRCSTSEQRGTPDVLPRSTSS